jgi:restriction system protein
MAIPTNDAVMLPVLRLCAGKTWHMRDLIRRISDDLGLSQAEREELLPGGDRPALPAAPLGQRHISNKLA